MSCSPTARGTRIAFIKAGGLTLSTYLAKLADLVKALRHFRIEALLEVEDEWVSILLLGVSGEVTHACLDMDGETLGGPEALERFRSLLGRSASRGYVELVRLSEEGYEIEAGARDNSRLPEPVKLAGLVKEAPGAPQQPGAAGDGALRSPITTGAATTAGISNRDLAMMLTELVLCSSVVGLYNNLEEAREAVERLSAGNPRAFYRLLVNLADGDVVNIFYVAGRPCQAIVLKSRGREAFVSPAGLEELVNNLSKRQVESIILQRVECEDLRSILGDCSAGEAGEEESREPQESRPPEAAATEPSPEPEEAGAGPAEEPRGRSSWLRRIFRRR